MDFLQDLSSYYVSYKNLARIFQVIAILASYNSYQILQDNTNLVSFLQECGEKFKKQYVIHV